MTCKDCISFAKCLDFECTPYYGLDSACNNVEQLCENFKNKADYTEVVHGHWIEDIKEICPFNGIVPMKALTGYRCSVCNRPEFLKEPYCNCGAKMDVSKMEITTERGAK